MLYKFFSLKRFCIVTNCALAALLVLNGGNAANLESATVGAEFVDPITITENNALQFDLLDQNFANTETIVIGTDSAVTDTASRVLGGTQAAANLTVVLTAGQSITILVDNIVNGTGDSLGSVLCSYDDGADTACDGAGMSATSVDSATLLIGATIPGDGLTATGAANGSFNVTVFYQ